MPDVIPLLKVAARPVVRSLREIPVWTDLMGQGGGARPRVALLPARGREDGASRLRIHAMAPALRRLGWRCLLLPPSLTLSQRIRLLGAFGPDVILMQGARHPLNRPALYTRYRVVYDMDDADFHLAHLEAPVRAAMGQVAAVIAGSRYIADWCLSNGAADAHVVWTGTPPTSGTVPAQNGRSPVVAWAQSRPMEYRPEADLVRAVMAGVAAQHPGVTLRLYDRRPGDDPAFADSFRATGLAVEWRKTCRYSDYLASFDDVAVGLAPLCPEDPFHRGKSFGKVLACLDRRVPVVASPVGEFPAFFTGETGVLADGAGGWVRAVTNLLADPFRRESIADRAAEAFRARLTTEVSARGVAAVLDRVQSQVTADRAHATLEA